ncbi:MAG: hypothetical protein RSD07_09470 [Angelakisella sp.]
MSNTIIFFIQLIETTPWQHLYAAFITGTVIMNIVLFTGYLVYGLSNDPVYRLILKVSRGSNVKSIMLPISIVIAFFLFFSPMVLLIGAVYVVDLNNKVMGWCKKKSHYSLQNRKD